LLHKSRSNNVRTALLVGIMKILFEDKSVVVCVKERGIVSQSDSSGGRSMISELESLCGCTIYPLHRLDKQVGGVMVYAKTKSSAAILSKDIVEHNFIKEYIALVHGRPQELKGEMRDLLFKDSRKNKTFVVKRERRGVKEALLDYEVLESQNGYSKVLIKLHTGRTHQIRVQFASRKMPLKGDRKYGAKDDFETIGLWSYRITFNHPESKEMLVFSQESDF